MIPWTGEQQKLLQAMGYALYVRAPAMTIPSAPTAASTATMPDCSRLLRSLQLASLGRDVSALVADIVALRGDAAAKRALWPKLRSLRRAPGTDGNQPGARAAHRP